MKLLAVQKEKREATTKDIPLEQGPDLLGTAVNLGLNLGHRTQLANLLEINLILAERILFQGVNVDFAESHTCYCVLVISWLEVVVKVMQERRMLETKKR
jgi:hypothetical protein